MNQALVSLKDMTMTARSWRILGLVLALQGMGIGHALATDVTISASYRGDAAGDFENTTPPADFCSQWQWNCSGFDSPTAELPISYTKLTVQGTADNRDRFFFQMPPRRQIQVTNHLTGAHYNLAFEFLQFSQEAQRISGDGTMPVMNFPKGGCNLRVNTSLSDTARFVWDLKNPQAPQPCWTEAGEPGTTISSAVGKTGVKFRMIMPRPVGIPQGTYTGSTQFTVGPGGDIDFGNGVTNLNDRLLTLNFDLKVEHDLSIIWPPGSGRAVLEPPGGWQAWLSGRGQPPRLQRDLPLRIWSTGPFKVYKRCQYEASGHCGIRNAAGHQVPVEVAITLPGNVQHGSGPARKVSLPTGIANAPVFEPQQVLGNHPGQLNFEVRGNNLPGMMANAGSLYEGEVTVVFDAEL